MAQVGRGTGPGTSPKLWDQSHIRDRGPVTDRTDCNPWNTCIPHLHFISCFPFSIHEQGYEGDTWGGHESVSVLCPHGGCSMSCVHRLDRPIYLIAIIDVCRHFIKTTQKCSVIFRDTWRICEIRDRGVPHTSNVYQYRSCGWINVQC